ncbi:MAG: hypothetical protein FWC96_06265 [Oscillospiraceae bacterium]|nr:hypothetical protein [Oscillospiraceae bacterium]
MKKLFLTLLCAVTLAAVLPGCTQTETETPNPSNPYVYENSPEYPAYPPDYPNYYTGNPNPFEHKELSEIIDNFEDSDEYRGRELMRRLKEDPAPVLEALGTALDASQEQALFYVSSVIAEVKRENQAEYDEYMNALNSAEAAELSERARQILGFVHANIEYFYSH